MQIYGYCRISTPRQNIERQVRNIAAAYPTGMQRHSSRKASESQRTAGRCGNSLPSCQKDRKHE